MLSSGPDREDVCQEALLRAWLHLEDLRRAEDFFAWLVGIGLNLARLHLRRVYLERRYRTTALALAPMATPGPQEAFERGELECAILEAVADLPEPYREAARLHYLEGWPTDEASRRMAVAEPTVRTRLHRARSRLRHRLSAWKPESRKERAMEEVTLEEVYREVREDVMHSILWLRSRSGTRGVPIWVGRFEGEAAAIQLRGPKPLRPMSHEIMGRLIEVLGGRLERVVIHSLLGDTYFATLVLLRDGTRLELDARPSDAINLALRAGAPIFVGPDIPESCWNQGMEPASKEGHRIEPLEVQWPHRPADPPASPQA